MLDPVGFWSYARQDDAHSDGQLSQLRAIVGKAIVLQCGVEVVVWQDVAAIPYGADWAETIERTLGQTTFFIPIVTPRFLKSENCRDEYLGFRRRMQTLGCNDLVFPVHYLGLEGMGRDETVFGDDLAALRQRLSSRRLRVRFRPRRRLRARGPWSVARDQSPPHGSRQRRPPSSGWFRRPSAKLGRRDRGRQMRWRGRPCPLHRRLATSELARRARLG